MIMPTGTRLWVAAALSVLLIGFLFPIYFIVVTKRSYDVKFGWERALAEAQRRLVIRAEGLTPAEAMVSQALA